MAKTRQVIHRPPGYEPWRDEIPHAKPNVRMLLTIAGLMSLCVCSAGLMMGIVLGGSSTTAAEPLTEITAEATPETTPDYMSGGGEVTDEATPELTPEVSLTPSPSLTITPTPSPTVSATPVIVTVIVVHTTTPPPTQPAERIVETVIIVQTQPPIVIVEPTQPPVIYITREFIRPVPIVITASPELLPTDEATP